MKSGIYVIKNIVNNKVYIGSAVDFIKRWRQHKNNLRKGKHHSARLLRAWNKYGEHNFKFELLQEVSNPLHLLSYEQVYLDYYKSYENEHGYNICKTAGSQYGLRHSEEAKRKISDAISGDSNPFKGRKHKPETIEHLRKINTGKKATEETRKKMSEAKNKPEILEKLKKINTGKKHSEETKNKIREAINKPEMLERLRSANTGKKATEETRKKMSEAKIRKKHTQKTNNSSE
jgi:group I intron endonuclease